MWSSSSPRCGSGLRSSTAYQPALIGDRVEIFVERVERRLGRGLGELDRREHGLLGLVADLLHLALAQHPGLDAAPREALDRVLLAPLLDLLALAVDLGVGGGVAAVAVGEGLQQGRLALLAGEPDPLGDRLAHRHHVHAVDPLARDAVALRLLGEVGLGRVALDRGAHPVEVVLDQEEDRQAPERRQVHRLAEVAGVGGAVAEHADGDRVFALVLGGERQPRGDRQVAADDPVAAHEAVLGVEDVHRAAAAAAGAVDPAEELRHHPLGLGAAGDRVAVGAVGADQVVLLAHHRGGADDRRLLADRQVQEAPRLRPLVLPPGLLLEAPDQRHPREQLVARWRRQGDRPRPDLSSRRRPPPPVCRRPRRPRRPRPAMGPRTRPLGGRIRRLAQGVLDDFGLDRLEQRLGVQLAGGGGDQHVVGIGEVAPGGEGLAEAGEGEGDGAPGLLGEGRGAHREQRVAGPRLGPDSAAAGRRRPRAARSRRSPRPGRALSTRSRDRRS